MELQALRVVFEEAVSSALAAAPLPLAWPSLLLFWPVFAWAFLPEIRIMIGVLRNGSIPDEDRGSLRVVFVGFILAVAAAFLLPFLAPRAALPGGRPAWFLLGMITLVSGSLLRRHCFCELGTFFTGAVTIRADHRVIDTGAYRWVRHPSYSGAILMALGIALSMGNWLGALASLVVVVPAYVYRANVEEAALRSCLGAPYARFAASRTRFIPFIC